MTILRPVLYRPCVGHTLILSAGLAGASLVYRFVVHFRESHVMSALCFSAQPSCMGCTRRMTRK